MGSTINILRAAFVACLIGGGITPAFAQDAPEDGPSAAPAPAPSAAPTARKSTANSKSDRVDIKDLENQYWAPKDTDFKVVQNRAYTKEHRFSITGMYGGLMDDSYSNANIYGLSANYYFNERMGIQLDFEKYAAQNNQSTSYFINNLGSAPDYTRPDKFYGVGFNYVPIYAKMSLLNKKIFYFDLAITPLVGAMTYDQMMQNSQPQKTALAYGFDVSEYFFFSQHFAIRTSIRDLWCQEQTVKYNNQSSGNNSGNEGDPRRDDVISTLQLLVGLTYFF
jgi:outer membrane beta-barrel protein